MRSLAHLGPIKTTLGSPEELLQLLVGQHFLSIENSLLVWHLNEGLAPAAGAFLSFDQASFEKVALFLQAQHAQNQLPKSEAGLVSILKPFCAQQCNISPEEMWAILEKKEYVQEQEGLCIWFGKHSCPASKRKQEDRSNHNDDEEVGDKTQQQRQKK